jgi:hypothetical protein
MHNRNDRARILRGIDHFEPIMGEVGGEPRKWRIQVMQNSHLLPRRTIDFCSAAI